MTLHLVVISHVSCWEEKCWDCRCLNLLLNFGQSHKNINKVKAWGRPYIQVYYSSLSLSRTVAGYLHSFL